MAFAFAVQAQTKWDMPTGYPADNFHTENIAQFVTDIEKATAGKLKITVHAGGSLFKANEIKRAVQGGQAQIGEIFISNFSNEDPIFGVDSIPFLATSYADAKKLWAVSKAATEARLA
ncbi:MAG: C4-dicarboxylate ABC transporter substrate-binding protein, partial [Betaproteobacteria bacterium]|nr:C4-dicarboxylate ABC transporter substrate-binding protein [Betaproteobacteria bacterium]